MDELKSVICERLKEYGFEWDNRWYPELYRAYTQILAVLKLRCGLPSSKHVRDIKNVERMIAVLDLILPHK